MLRLSFLLLAILSLPSSFLYPYEYELAIAAIFKNEAPNLREWIEYHKMAGVEHFWLYDDGSPDNWQEVLKPYQEEGIVEVIDWSNHPNTPYVVYQVSAYKDALKKARDKTKWLALIDIDEFILPLRDKTITACLNERFEHAPAVFACWLNFGTSHVWLPSGTPILFHLYACAPIPYGANGNGKSIIRPELAKIEEVWYAHHVPLKEGEFYYYGDGTPIPPKGDRDWAFDGKHHGAFLRLNHYYFKDENFYQNVKLPRAKYFGYGTDLLERQYQQYNCKKDTTIMRFIMKHHPEAYKKIWEEQ